MRDCTLAKARTYKHVVVEHRGVIKEVTSIHKWGKNWEVQMDDGLSMVVPSTYQGLMRTTKSELIKLTS